MSDLPIFVVDSRFEPVRDGQAIKVALTTADGVGYRLEIVWLTEGWPSDVRRAIDGQPTPWPRNVVIGAPQLSPGALDELRRRDANWLDECGNVRLVVPPGLAVVKSSPAPSPPKRWAFNWSASSVTIAELLLSSTSTRHALPQVAQQSAWSLPQTSLVLAAFDERGWTSRHGPKRGPGVWREVTNPGSLLDAWSDHLGKRRPARRLGHRSMRDPMATLEGEIAPRLADRGRWAVSGWAGLALTAPFMTQVPVLHLYLGADIYEQAAGKLLEEVEARPVDSGANIEVWRLDGPVISTMLKGDTPVINAPRLYSDLLALGGRGEDAARHLRETVLGY
jgi:hypothetical protein